MKLYSIDLFSGVGGLTQGLRKAGFQTKMAFEIDELASSVYKLNHKRTKVITDNIRNVSTEKVKNSSKAKRFTSLPDVHHVKVLVLSED